MKLSVVIVSYNTRYFIDLCIASVIKSLANIEGEIIIVDNNSSDKSPQFIKKQYPNISLIENKQNEGFGRANNQGIKAAKGEYVLLLNPDTLVPEACLKQCINYLDNHPDKGALGVKMVDGSGHFLPESKRGLPTPKTAFYKMSGLYRLCPKSAEIARYYHGNIAEDETHDVDILTGAFFMARKTIGDNVGWFDEAYFMYGEDIDLSYSFTQAGYPIVYFPLTSIVHFKGESSKDVDKKYIENFFGAMQIFYNKHFEKQYSSLFRFLVLVGIWLKAVLVRISQVLNQQKNLKNQVKKRNFVVWASADNVKAVCASLLKITPEYVQSKQELNISLSNKSGAVSLVFTSEISLEDQVMMMKEIAKRYPKIEYFFLSPKHDFILGSNSKKLNGMIFNQR